MDLKCSHLETPLGPMLLAASAQGLAGAWFEGQQHMPNFEGWKIDRQNPHLKQAARELTDYFSGARAPFKVRLSAAWGTAFQHAVWKALQGIRCGQTTSYGQLALQLKKPMASRAVGAAVGKNPWSIIVPCHRVLPSGGGVGQFGGGVAAKEWLLRREGSLD